MLAHGPRISRMTRMEHTIGRSLPPLNASVIETGIRTNRLHIRVIREIGGQIR
jgi:hypothetical protein